MTKIMELNSIRDTTLWKRLENGFKRKNELQSLVTKLLSTVEELCDEATARMKTMPSFHQEFTLHDETHLLRVTELMGKVLGKYLKCLSPVELGLLMLAAHFHDQGMVVENDKINEVKESAEWKIYRDTWTINHPNLREIQQQLKSPNISKQEKKCISLKLSELQQAMISEYVRQKHGRFSGEFIRGRYGSDKRLEIVGVNISDMLAQLCESHVLPGEEIKTLHCDELVGTNLVNLRYLAVVLRLSDILDFDRDRTPDILYRTIHFTNDVSIQEWEKHRSVQGWVISPELVRFDMKFEHPVYERTARGFLDWIDMELVWANEIIRTMPREFGKTYKLDLPQRVDRSRIGPKNNCYVYYDLEFSLSRDEIVKLLMSKSMYRHPSLCIRELLQNSLDALRYRAVLYKVGGLDWKEGMVSFEHRLDKDGYERLCCWDNGVGMDEFVITNFLTKVGRSFYRSPYFEQERVRFRESSVDFDPCSQFGIGFMACFMLGDFIRIETRRDYGPGRELGKPLTVEINGLGGLLVIRPGRENQQIGTRITITARDKLNFIDSFSDRIQLIRTIKGFTVAAEFPIKAKCYISGLDEQVEVTTRLETLPTLLERAGIKQVVTLEESFSDVDPRFRGHMRATFLADENGIPTTANKVASYKPADTYGESWRIISKPRDGVSKERIFFCRPDPGQICIDGILVAGIPGKGQKVNIAGAIDDTTFELGFTYMLDIRGDLKPRITPARTAPFQQWPWPIWTESSWERVAMVAQKTTGWIWESIISFLKKGMTYETFWEITAHRRFGLPFVRSNVIWDKLAVPLSDSKRIVDWRSIKNLGMLKPKVSRTEDEQSFSLYLELFTQDGLEVRLEPRGIPRGKITSNICKLLISMSTLSMEKDQLMLNLLIPCDPNSSPSTYELPHRWLNNFAYAIPYEESLSNVIAVQSDIDTANRGHPLVRKALETRTLEQLDEIQLFAKIFVLNVANQFRLKDIHKNRERSSAWMKHCAYLFSCVDWLRVDRKLRPPYRIWLKQEGSVEITETDFLTWGEMDIQLTEDDEHFHTWPTMDRS